MKLPTRVVEKPWGRLDLIPPFDKYRGRRVGEIWFEGGDDNSLPLLAKFLFTSERLSIQVHPDDAAAEAVGMANGKDECWLVLDAQPGAHIGVGLNRSVTATQLRAAAMDGSIEQLMDWRPAQAGDFIYNPAGNIHALGPGLCVLEIQQPSECTYRLYDYDRPRELHLNEGIAVATLAPLVDPRNTTVSRAFHTITLVEGPKFRLIYLHGPDDLKALEEKMLLILPLGPGCSVNDEPIAFGEAAYARAAALTLEPDARALVAIPV